MPCFKHLLVVYKTTMTTEFSTNLLQPLLQQTVWGHTQIYVEIENALPWHNPLAVMALPAPSFSVQGAGYHDLVPRSSLS